jgi:mRNA interferase YafQ
MRRIEPSSKFEKDLKTVKKYPKYDKAPLASILDKLANGEKLDDKFKDHKMAKHSPKGLNDCRNFHLAPNICVLYRITDDTLTVIRIGSHQDLGLTEELHTC